MKNASAISPVAVAIVEDDARFSRGLVKALNVSPRLRCVGSCKTKAEALAQLASWRPDAVLLDLDLGTGRDGLDMLPELTRRLPTAKFLVLTAVEDADAIFQAASRGAHGYLRKSISITDLPLAIIGVHEGDLRLSPDVLRRIWERFRPSVGEQTKLSPREAEVLELLAEGYERKEIAARLELSGETIKTYVRSIHQKLCVCTTEQAVQKVYPRKRLRIV